MLPGPDGGPLPAFDAKVLRAFVVDGRLASIPAQEKKKLVVLRYLRERCFAGGPAVPGEGGQRAAGPVPPGRRVAAPLPGGVRADDARGGHLPPRLTARRPSRRAGGRSAMDTWKFYAITHADHVVCNPRARTGSTRSSACSTSRPVPAPGRPPAGRASCWCGSQSGTGAGGVGVDISPYELRVARDRAAPAGAGRRPAVRRGRRRDPAGRAVERRPGGMPRRELDLGRPPRHTPGAARDGTPRRPRHGWRTATGNATPNRPTSRPRALRPILLATHHGNVAIGAEEGLVLLWTMASSEADWDRYEMLQLRAAERYARTTPNDPDVPELLGRVRADVESYLRWGRDTLGWAVYLFRVPA